MLCLIVLDACTPHCMSLSVAFSTENIEMSVPGMPLLLLHPNSAN